MSHSLRKNYFFGPNMSISAHPNLKLCKVSSLFLVISQNNIKKNNQLKKRNQSCSIYLGLNYKLHIYQMSGVCNPLVGSCPVFNVNTAYKICK